MCKLVTGSLVLLTIVIYSSAQNANVQLPAFKARLSLGFNYDLLRDPTDVSFEYPKGYFGFNLPLQKTVNIRDYAGVIQPGIDSIFSDSSLFTNGDNFRPTGSARQNPNITVRVDVPMMGGVASFSNTQNFFFNYENILGNPSVFLDTSANGMKFLLRGTVNVPVNLKFGWETMTFGYAYRVNKLLTFALNLHRHVFTFDLRAKIDADLMGKYDYQINSSGQGFQSPSINGVLDYPSDKFYGQADGHYDAEVWSPTIGLNAWRFTMVSRFGVNTRAHGSLYAKYSLPFFIDPENFSMAYDLKDPEIINDPQVRQNLMNNAADSVVYSTNNDLVWKLPTGLTFSFDIIPDKIKFSYTKMIGDIEMKLDRIAKEQKAIETSSNRHSNDSIVVDLGVTVDNVMMLECNLFNSFVNLGIFGLDFSYGDQKHLLGNKIPEFRLGKSAMVPVLNFGSAIGTKMKLLLELDVLPLPALKTGVFYYF
jgi:hypothetical protein